MWEELTQPFKARWEDFEVVGKDDSVEQLEKWRRSSLVLNSARRFRYTADLESRQQNALSLSQLRVALTAVERFKKGLKHDQDTSLSAAQAEGFGVGTGALKQLMENQNVKDLDKLGGVEGVARNLRTDLSTGLGDDVEAMGRRVRVFGSNTYPEKPFKGFFSFVWDAMQDFTLIILAVCAVVSLLVGVVTEGLAEGWYDGGGILLSILLVVVVTATSDYRQAQQFSELDKEKKKVSMDVLRSGVRTRLSIYDIVVGDVVMLATGDVVPADGLFISGYSLVIDESSMTGESLPLQKSTESPFLLSGTRVQDGSAAMLVVGVGMQTEWGSLMAKLTDAGDDETPLQVKLNGVATLVGRLGLVVAVLVFVVLMAKQLAATDLNKWDIKDTLRVVDNFAIAVTIIVVAVPEGLPLAVTLSLAFAMKQMMRDKALVRKLAACETMGSATTICSDKTGTLTANQMTVVQAWMQGTVVATLPTSPPATLSPSFKDVLFQSIFTCTSGEVQPGSRVIGSPTEAAILHMGLHLGGRYETEQGRVTVVRVDPFNSKRKRMAVVLRLTDGTFRVHWKGAAEIILGMCDNVVGRDGKFSPLSRGELDSTILSFANSSLRTLSLAYRDLLPHEVPAGGAWTDDSPIPSDGLTLLGVVGIKDPLRAGVAEAVQLCRKAGIKVRMVTGDNLNTGMAIARECGILTEGGEAIEGPKFRTLTREQMKELLPRLQVMARSSPTDKHTMVNCLREMGEVVAVTGDGTNDAPALKEADIGLAMGIAGTEVAKESADVIILDDNFSSIVNVAKWGRSVYTNIQKFVQFQLTVNIVALVTNFVSACTTGSAPLTAVQLLWVNLIMDTLGALALATEPPSDALMHKPPTGRRTRFISLVMWRNIIGQSVFQLSLMAVLHVYGARLFGFHAVGEAGTLHANTIIFNTFVFCQVFNEINSRNMESIDVFSGIFSNGIFLFIMAITVLFQVVLVQCLGKFASTVPLSLHDFLLCVALGSIAMPVAALVKLIPVPASITHTEASVEDHDSLTQPLMGSERV